MRKELISARDAAGTLLLLHALLSILMYILKFWISDDFTEFLGSGMPGFVSSALIMQGICILLPTIFVMAHYGLSSDLIPGPSTPTGGWTIMSATVGIPAAIVFTGLNNGYIYILYKSGVRLPSAETVVPEASVEQAGGGIAGFIVVLILSVLLPGIVEELMFRGVIQGAASAGGQVTAAIIIQAVVFAVFHVDILFLIAPFLAGLLLGYIRHKTGTVYAPVLAHITMNLTILLMKPLLPALTAEYVAEMTSNAVLYASLIAAAAASVALIPMLVAFSSVRAPQTRKERQAKFFPVDHKFIIGALILTGSMLFYYFTNR